MDSIYSKSRIKYRTRKFILIPKNKNVTKIIYDFQVSKEREIDLSSNIFANPVIHPVIYTIHKQILHSIYRISKRNCIL